MPDEPAPEPKAASRTESALAGAGGGTLLALLANNLSPANGWRPWLIILAPSASVAVSAIWIFSRTQLAAYWQERDALSGVKQTRTALEKMLKRASNTEEHKAVLRQRLEELDAVEYQIRRRRIRALSPSEESAVDNAK